MSLPYIGQQLTIYCGFSLLITGITGNVINILVFLSVRTYRTTPCTFYFLAASIYNIVEISTILTSRIVMAGYGIDLTKTSTSWCKIRQFIIVTVALTSVTCTCLATIDQFFATSQTVYLRRLSNIKWARRIVLIVPIFWFLYGIPIFVYYDISPITNSCVNTGYAYNIYYPVYVIGLLCIIPSFTMIIFGYLTYRNIHMTRALAQQQADRQLVRMIFVEIILVLVSFAPIGIYSIYMLITANISKDAERTMKETLALTISNTIVFVYYGGSCYMFLLSSSRFRQATKNLILLRLRPNHIVPTT